MADELGKRAYGNGRATHLPNVPQQASLAQAGPVKSVVMDSGGYKIVAIMCDLPDCGSLASGIYYDADGAMVRRCTLHIPQAPAFPEEPCPA